MNTFSIVLPVYSTDDPNFDRKKTTPRAIRSILNQQYPHWELIIVNDGCTDSLPETLEEFAQKDPRIKILNQSNFNRAIARNNGMEETSKDWLCWLDSDDEYSSHYLRELNQAILDFPDYKIFNFASLIYFPDHRSEIRPAFKPERKGKGHKWFCSGQIAAGSFIFKRDLWQSDPKYRIPDQSSPYAFAAVSGFDMKMPERPELFTDKRIIEAEGALNIGDSLGNPWGDDFYQFYLLTRDNFTMPLDVALYIQYPRSSEGIYEYF